METDWLSVILRYGLIAATFVFSASAAELKQDTLEAWQDSVQLAKLKMQQRLRPESHFLKIEDDRAWVAKVRSGEILVLPDSAPNLKKVPSGIVHQWFGAAFIEHATLNDVMAVARDYDSYKEFYRPTVADSKTLQRAENEDRFSMVVVNQSLLVKTALDVTYLCSYFHLNDQQLYSMSEATSVREIENYGSPGQRELPEDEGSGFIWRLFSIMRYEERDGGVYVELETLGLSRDIPFSVRWIVEPVVRRVSRESLAASLKQTQSRVRSVQSNLNSYARR